ncbi:MAG TPA: tetratricopeptide repeat protein [Blastocatellia bacterium]|nr:tetratricopeptide repeat protein [Blastocatellia bacterium]
MRRTVSRKKTLGLVAAMMLLSCFCAFRLSDGLPGKVSSESRGKLAGDALRRGEDLRRRWSLDAAEAAFLEAAQYEPTSVEVSLGLARIARAKLDYRRAISLLDKASGQQHESIEVINEYGLVFLAAEDAERARQYFERAVAGSATDIPAQIGLAAVEMLERDYGGAEARLRACLAREPQNSDAHAMLARVLLESDKSSHAAAEAQRAVALDALNVDALYALAYARSVERNATEARTLAGRVVGLDSFNFGARRLLSQYVDGDAGYKQKVPEQARAYYERGRTFKQEGDLTKAEAEFDAALAIEPRYYRALIAIGDVCLRQGDYDRAASAAKLATSVDPNGALGHLELSCAYRGIQDHARKEIGATDFEALFYDGGPHSAYAATREVFPNYSTLNKRQQAVIDSSVAPLASFLPKLARRKARHYLLACDQRPSDLRGFADVADEKTFDGRYYDSLRGVGGRVAVSGIEYLDQAARGGFNTIAHEFAHQVHIAALGKIEVKAIHNLYERARRGSRTLDYYAAANEYEYFAQGYEAFVSGRKRPSAGVTGRHTGEELARRDPELYKFLLNLSGKRPDSGGVRH